MCTACFKAGNHIDHETLLNYSSGMGGCCDCGDKEAWKQNSNTCSIHHNNPAQSPPASIPTVLVLIRN